MNAGSLALFLFTAAALAAAGNPEQRLSKLEKDVAELQTLVRALDKRGRQEETPLPTIPEEKPRGSRHLIRTGDSFWSISRKYDVPVSALQRANPEVSPRRLPIGKQLIIPGHLETTTPSPASNGLPVSHSGTYTVRKGDILGQISENHGIRLHQLLEANPGINPRTLQIGTVLTIPGQPAPPFPDPVAPPEKTPPVIPDSSGEAPPVEDFQPVPPPEIKGLGWLDDRSPALTSAFDHQKTKLVTVEANMRLSEVANQHATSVAVLNQLNELDLSPEQMIKTGSQLYVPGR